VLVPVSQPIALITRDYSPTDRASTSTENCISRRENAHVMNSQRAEWRARGLNKFLSAILVPPPDRGVVVRRRHKSRKN
jgi:hypothetical protein